MRRHHQPGVRRGVQWAVAAACGAVTCGAVGLPALAAAAQPAPNPGKQPAAYLLDGTLHVLGTNDKDAITLWVEPGQETYVSLRLHPTIETRRFPRKAIRAVDVHLFDGDDAFAATRDLKEVREERPSGLPWFSAPMTVAAGAGNDRVLAGPGADSVLGGPGDDRIEGFGGNDAIDAGEGNDTVAGGAGRDRVRLGGGQDLVTWSTGQGGDVIDGGLGQDLAGFRGSSRDERMAVSAKGRVAVLRTGRVAVPFTGIEDVIVRPGEGADSVTIGSTRGTGVRSVGVDLYGDKLPDRRRDVVTVTGTSRRDQVLVGAKDTTAVVGGLQPVVLVGGVDQRLDVLAIDTGLGRDTVEVRKGVRELVDLRVSLGPDQRK